MNHSYQPEEDMLCPVCLCPNRDCECVENGLVEEFDFGDYERICGYDGDLL